jgi:hypothetical protein
MTVFRRLSGEFAIDEDEAILFSHGCSSVPRTHWRSFVGGTIYVTTRRVIFVPNRLATLLRRKRWVIRKDDVEDLQFDLIAAGRVFGTLPALKMFVRPEAGTSGVRTIVMNTRDLVEALATAIEGNGPHG